MGQLKFACGAAYEMDDEPRINPRTGRLERMFVFALRDWDGKSPAKEGVEMNCLSGCPARVRESRRKEFRAWVGKNADGPTGNPTRCVTCEPVSWEE